MCGPEPPTQPRTIQHQNGDRDQFFHGNSGYFRCSMRIARMGILAGMRTTTGSNRPDGEYVPTREGYDRWAEVYDSERSPLIELEQPRVDALLGNVAGLHVCDLGCGTGRHAVRLATAGGARVTAIDFSDGMVARAADKPGWERVQFVEHDLTRPLPLRDAAFDRVLSGLVVDHIPDLAAFFRECGRICRPDGFIVISTVHPAMLLRGVIAHFTDPATGRDVFPESRPHQISDYVMGVVRAGLTLDDIAEYAVDDALAARNARAAKFLHWPLLMMMRMRPVG